MVLIAYAAGFALFFSFFDGVLLRINECNTDSCVMSRKKLNGEKVFANGSESAFSDISDRTSCSLNLELDQNRN